MADILPNLITVVVALVLWLVSRTMPRDSRASRRFMRGAAAALAFTCVCAVPPFVMSVAVGDRGPGMVWMLSYVLASLSVLGGGVAFLIGIAWPLKELEAPTELQGVDSPQPSEEDGRSPRVMAQLRQGAMARRDVGPK